MPYRENPTLEEAKEQLDLIIVKARSDLYKPIQIAELLYRVRKGDSGVNIFDIDTFKNSSLRWRDDVTRILLKKKSTSSARYQHDIWNNNAMYPAALAKLSEENKLTNGAIERYIYLSFQQKQDTIASIIALLETTTTNTFSLEELLAKFRNSPGLKRSIDKAYEIVVYSLLETIVTSLEASVKVSIPTHKIELLKEFPDLAMVLLGLSENTPEYTTIAHVYRVGVTNAADRGLDMWANFGPAIQVKHMTLDSNLAENIVRQVDSHSIVIVCREAEQQIIETILLQTDYGMRIKGIITDTQLISWYRICFQGTHTHILAQPLLNRLVKEFKREFPASTGIVEFLEERGYAQISVPELWQVRLTTEF